MRVAAIFLLLAGLLPAQEFRSEVNLINVSAVVRGSDGTLVHNLNKQDFEIREDGVPQTVQLFAHERDLPLRLGIIIDVSGSQDHFGKEHARDIEAFLHSVLQPRDQAFAVCFGNHLRLISDLTNNPDQIFDGLKRFDHGDRDFPQLGPNEDRDLGTALFDAAYYAIKEKVSTSEEERLALILFTDGEENSSEHDLLDAVEAAQTSNTVVYCIRYTDIRHGKMSVRNRYGIRVLDHLSSLTGGLDLDGKSGQLSASFSQIADELRSMYQFGYVSTNPNPHDGTYRKLTVTCTHEGTRIRAKTGYYAR